MNNVVSLHSNRPEAFNGDSPLYFPVYERPAMFTGKDGTLFEAPNHKHIVRMHNGAPVSLAVVGKNYKVLHNKELCEGIEDTFMESMTKEELDGVTRRDKISYLGGQSIRDYIFPNINTDIGSKASNVAFRVIVINGYDGASSFKFYHGAIDFFCTNGMVSGVYDMMVKRHTSGLTIPSLTDRLRKSIDIFYRQAETWKHWVKKVISDEDAEQCFKAMPNISDRRVQQLMHQFRIECQTHGRTIWAMYSAATYYATSNQGQFTVRETGLDHSASTLMNREQQVRAWLNQDEFNKIAA